MSDLQLKTDIAVYTEMDRVVFRIGSIDIFLPYAVTFKIAQGLRVACKRTSAVIHEAARWNDLARDSSIEVQDYADVRPGRQVKGKFPWSIRCDGERVYLNLGDLTATLHFVDALKISQWLRAGGRTAKRWAGDTSKSMVGLGMLTDAEENYRLGLR